VSYAALLNSLARTPRGDDDYVTVLGTLMRQSFNEGHMVRAAPKASGESQRHEAHRRGVSLYRVRVDRGASTGKGAGVTRRGTTRSPTRIIADLRSVGWGGDARRMRQSIAWQQLALDQAVSRQEQNQSLDSFGGKAPARWVHTVDGRHDEWVHYAIVNLVTLTEPPYSTLKYWGTIRHQNISPYECLDDIRKSYDQGLEYANAHGSPPEEDTVIAGYEYAGARHVVRGGVGR
jgi:hypothetical protein